jgi:LL-diaminopimelate aminotransferase
VHDVPLRASHDFHPDLDAIPPAVAEAAKVLTINYPHNPTGGTETDSLYERIQAFARRYDVCVISDIAYCDLSLEPGYRARSMLEFDREKTHTVEFHSFSKTYSMQGWRVGFVAGNRQLLANLARIKSNMDFSIFMAIQVAATAALEGEQDYPREMSALYRRRRDVFLEGIAKLGYRLPAPKGGMYVWMPVPPGFASSIEFTKDLLNKTGVVVSPGVGFGPSGEGYVRVALCVEEDRLREAIDRMAKAGVNMEAVRA